MRNKDYKYQTAAAALLLALVLIAVSVVTARMAEASTCQYFTPEQRNVLRIAYAVGDRENLGDTLSAIVWREALGCRPGAHVCTENLTDGDHGAYGVCQMQITTYAWHFDRVGADRFEWADYAGVAQRLIGDPVFALEACLSYLVEHVEARGWREGIARYHGGGQAATDYSADIVGKVRHFEAGCRP